MSERRDFLKFMGTMSLIATTSSCATTVQKSKNFSALQPSSVDDVKLIKGLEYQKLITWGDSLTANKKFGYNNDFISILEMDKNNAIMWVNHESVTPLFVSGFNGKNGKTKTKKQIDTEKSNVGGSVFKISRENENSKWRVVKDHTVNNRLDSHTKIPFAPKQKIFGSYEAVGTLMNCAGGQTPWGTFLTCEENFYNVYGESEYTSNKRIFKSSLHRKSSWEADSALPPEHYGWVVEYNPVTKDSKKLVALGRFCHEGATPVMAADGRTVVYMADDANNQFVYKFISKNKGSLLEGQLFVADTIKGNWLELSYEKNKKLKKKFKNQQDVLVRAREAAKLLGATPLDRPEDIERNPITGEIFITLTNNKDKGNYHGAILKIKEDNNDYLSLKFTAETYKLGGASSGFSCPDNMVFDKKGNLWLTTDISGKAINKFPYQQFEHNGLFYIPLSGEDAGSVYQVASAPVDAEFTGLCFAKDQKTLFLSVQHPGENSKSLDKLTSTWNSQKGSSIPRPAIIMISGPVLDKIV